MNNKIFNTYVILATNKDRTIFYCTYYITYIIKSHQGYDIKKMNHIIFTELKIINKIENEESIFYTDNPNGGVTKVKVENGNIKSENNETKKDNINSLPII